MSTRYPKRREGVEGTAEDKERLQRLGRTTQDVFFLPVEDDGTSNNTKSSDKAFSRLRSEEDCDHTTEADETSEKVGECLE